MFGRQLYGLSRHPIDLSPVRQYPNTALVTRLLVFKYIHNYKTVTNAPNIELNYAPKN